MAASRPCPTHRRRGDIRSHRSATPSGVPNARYGLGNFWSASTGSACPTTDLDGKPASHLTREPRSVPLYGTWPRFWRRIEDSASATSYDATCWRAVISGFLTPDSSSSSMRASTLRARGSSRSPCTRTCTPWGSPQSAGWRYANITMQRTTIPRTATNNALGTTHCGTSSRQSMACSQR